MSNIFSINFTVLQITKEKDEACTFPDSNVEKFRDPNIRLKSSPTKTKEIIDCVWTALKSGLFYSFNELLHSITSSNRLYIYIYIYTHTHTHTHTHTNTHTHIHIYIYISLC